MWVKNWAGTSPKRTGRWQVCSWENVLIAFLEQDKMPDRIHLKEFGLTFGYGFRGLSPSWWGAMVGQSSLCHGGSRSREIWDASAHLAFSLLPLFHETVVPTCRWTPSVSYWTSSPGNVTIKTNHHLCHWGISTKITMKYHYGFIRITQIPNPVSICTRKDMKQ